ncbi:MAG: YkgJ family cysteine cluster protein [Deltaproteobacteria bacterium]|nr:YkgJ family cysteine cluster protein [Deltaproteobacteria bacterium]
MDFDFTPYFRRYETLRSQADKAFERVSKEYPENVRCRSGCADCCHALFDLTLIEALYINQKFNEKYQGPEREALLEKANKLDRQIVRIKRQAGRDLQNGKPEKEILEELARVRVACPLLDDRNLCALYEFRPITCRFYGIPTAINAAGHTCGLSGFETGRAYPTVNLDSVHRQLQQITAELVRDMGSKFINLSDLLVPLSMALVTLFDAEYLGIDYTAAGQGEGGPK